MRFGPDQNGFDRRRAVALGLVLGLHLLLVLLLVSLVPARPSKPPGDRELIAFNVLPDKPVAVPKPATRPKRTAGAKAKATPAPKILQKPQDKLFTVQLFEGVDITKLPNHSAERSEGLADAGVGPDSDTAYGPGEGPGGERLYNAEWQREPTNAELAFYIPKTGAPTGSYALIACKTIERYQVDDCRQLEEAPRGSGLSRAMVNAAWQFRVKPPRIGGKSQVGAWVRIKITFSEKPEA